MTMAVCTLAVIYLVSALVTNVSCWPAGTYGIPMPKSGCPITTNFQWKSGTRTQKTERGSKASKDVHLAGIENEPTDKVVQNFCMKTSPHLYGDYAFSPGSYCIFKLGNCPEGFREGWIYWDDDDSSWFSRSGAHASTGTLPDGSYSKNTKIEYCCRNDARPSKPLTRLPTDLPFYLLKWGDECQKVKGMHVTEEWVYWSDESKMNLNSQGGLHPTVVRAKYPDKYTKVFYCYYEPQLTNLTPLIAMSVVVGFVLLTALIFFVIKFVLMFRKPKKPETSVRSRTKSLVESVRSSDIHVVSYVPASGGPAGRPSLLAVVPEEEELTECVCGSPGGLTLTSDDVFTPCEAEENPGLAGHGEHEPLVSQIPGRQSEQAPVVSQIPERRGQTEHDSLVFQFPDRHSEQASTVSQIPAVQQTVRLPSYDEAIQTPKPLAAPPYHSTDPIKEETQSV